MSKWANDAVMDAALDKIATATTLTVCSGQPANYAGIAAVALADVTIDSGDFSKSDGTSGRKVTIGAQNGVTIDASDDATHVALDDGTNLLYVTTCTTKALTSGDSVNVPAWSVQFGDPS